MTEVVSASGSEKIARAISVLNRSGVVAVPTDTVWGLVTRYDDEAAMERIYALKGRSEEKPLPVLLGTATELALVAEKPPQSVWPLIYRFWPGPLTIIVRALPSLSAKITAGTGTVGVRVPAHPAALDILEALRFPLASTSANKSGSAPAQTAEEVVAIFGDAVDLVQSTDGSDATGHASTVVDLTTQPYLIRRRGDITPAEVRAALAARVEIAEGA